MPIHGGFGHAPRLVQQLSGARAARLRQRDDLLQDCRRPEDVRQRPLQHPAHQQRTLGRTLLRGRDQRQPVRFVGTVAFLQGRQENGAGGKLGVEVHQPALHQLLHQQDALKHAGGHSERGRCHADALSGRGLLPARLRLLPLAAQLRRLAHRHPNDARRPACADCQQQAPSAQ